MADTITALRADHRDPNRVHVYIEGSHVLSVSLDVAAAERLTVGQPCPPERLSRLHAAQQIDNIYASALNFLSYRPRSAREVEMRLRKKGYTPEQIENVIARLTNTGLVDDVAFARFWVSNRLQFSPRGPRLLKSELRQKGVSIDIVDQVLAEQRETTEAAAVLFIEAQEASDAEGGEDDVMPGSDLANALALARKRMRSLSNLEPQVAKRRLAAFLARRGYGYDIIGQVWNRITDAEDDADSME